MRSIDRARLAQFLRAERFAFAGKRQFERQEAGALQSQRWKLKSLRSNSSKSSKQQRGLNHQMVAQYESMMSSVSVGKPNIEVKREEARVGLSHSNG